MGNTNSCIEDIKTVNTKIDEVLSLARDCKQKIQEFQNLKEMYQNKVEEIKKNIDQTNISIEKKKTKIEQEDISIVIKIQQIKACSEILQDCLNSGSEHSIQSKIIFLRAQHYEIQQRREEEL